MVKVSVVIPTYDRPAYVKAVLETLVWQTFKNFEVIISDDGSESGTYEKVREFEGKLDLKYVWQRDKPWNQPEAKNLGMKLARGELVFLSDDYVFYPPNCLALHVRMHNEIKGRIMIYGLKFGIMDLKPNQVMQYLKTSFPKDCKRWQLMLPSAQKNFSVRREDVYKINGYDQDFCGHWGYDDLNFGSRLARSGVRLITARNIPSLLIPHKAKRGKSASFNKKLYDRKNILSRKGIEKIVCYNGLFDRRSV